MLLAILMGNALYFAMMPLLPEYLRHSLYAFDPALLLDFAICIAVYIAIRRLSG